MNTVKTTRILGLAFLLQFVTSFASGMFLRETWFVPGNINASLIKIANNALGGSTFSSTCSPPWASSFSARCSLLRCGNRTKKWR